MRQFQSSNSEDEERRGEISTGQSTDAFALNLIFSRSRNNNGNPLIHHWLKGGEREM